MKKALITFVLTIMLSAGMFFSAGNNILSADEAPEHKNIESMVVSGSGVYFEIDIPDLEYVIIEYSYFKKDILFSKLFRAKTQKVSIDTNTGLTRYFFQKPSESESFKIWRVVHRYTINSTANGEYIKSPDTALSTVAVRVKQLTINNDLITKEAAYTERVGSRAFTFRMHFDIIDENGNNVPIDNITAARVEYDVQTIGVLNSQIQHKVFDIQEREFIKESYWPYFTPFRIKENIGPSFDDDYTWMIELGTYVGGPGIIGIKRSDVILDKTTILTIDYVYNGVFYKDQVVIDEPYDKDDIIHVNPGTTDPYTSVFDKIKNMLSGLDNIINVIIIVVLGIAGIMILSLISKAFAFINLIGKAIWLFFKLVYRVAKFIVIDIPGYIVKFIAFLVTPKDKRKEQTHVNRYL